MKKTRPRREEGAVAVITALVLVVLMAGVALTVDVGGLLLRRRAMVNGPTPPRSPPPSRAPTRPWAVLRRWPTSMRRRTSRSPTGTHRRDRHRRRPESGQQWTLNCGVDITGHVSVRYESDQSLFFAPVLGFDHTSEVRHVPPPRGARQVRRSDPAGDLRRLLPGEPVRRAQRVREHRLRIWEDNDLSGGGNFGFLDVGEGWDVGKADQCNNVGGADQLGGWISGADPAEIVELNYPNATWVCTRESNGGNNVAWRRSRTRSARSATSRSWACLRRRRACPGRDATAQVQRDRVRPLRDHGREHAEQEHAQLHDPARRTLPFDLMAACAPSGGTYIEGSRAASRARLTVDANGVISAWSRQPSA